MGINAPENLYQEYINENYDYLNDILTYGLDTWGIEL